jgi:uncharacterized protein with PQ loop repeat
MEIVTMALGLVAGALTTIAFLPQVRKTWKSKSAPPNIKLMLWHSFDKTPYAFFEMYNGARS